MSRSFNSNLLLAMIGLSSDIKYLWRKGDKNEGKLFNFCSIICMWIGSILLSLSFYISNDAYCLKEAMLDARITKRLRRKIRLYVGKGGFFNCLVRNFMVQWRMAYWEAAIYVCTRVFDFDTGRKDQKIHPRKENFFLQCQVLTFKTHNFSLLILSNSKYKNGKFFLQAFIWLEFDAKNVYF